MCKRLLYTYVVFVACRACDQVHSITFTNKKSFLESVCRFNGYPVFSSRKSYQKVYKAIVQDLAA